MKSKIILSTLYGSLGKPMGLVDQIKAAASGDEITSFLEAGNQFSMASDKTKRRWRYVAQRRLQEIQLRKEKKAAPVEQAVGDSTPTPEKKQKVPGKKPYKSKKT